MASYVDYAFKGTAAYDQRTGKLEFWLASQR